MEMPSLRAAYDLALDGSNNIYSIIYERGEVKKVNSENGALLARTEFPNRQLISISTDKRTNNIYVYDVLNHQILKLDSLLNLVESWDPQSDGDGYLAVDSE